MAASLSCIHKISLNRSAACSGTSSRHWQIGWRVFSVSTGISAHLNAFKRHTKQTPDLAAGIRTIRVQQSTDRVRCIKRQAVLCAWKLDRAVV
eukprot:6187133-Pleurochrysis_carterae.AAC.1